MKNKEDFTIISVFLNGIFKRATELNEMVRRESPDVVCIQETHTREGIIPMIRNYTNFGNSWISSAKGVADYINLKMEKSLPMRR